MTVKETLVKRKITQLKAALDNRINPCVLNKYLNGWVKIPEDKEKSLANYLKVSIDSIRKNSIKE